MLCPARFRLVSPAYLHVRVVLSKPFQLVYASCTFTGGIAKSLRRYNVILCAQVSFSTEPCSTLARSLKLCQQPNITTADAAQPPLIADLMCGDENYLHTLVHCLLPSYGMLQSITEALQHRDVYVLVTHYSRHLVEQVSHVYVLVTW